MKTLYRSVIIGSGVLWPLVYGEMPVVNNNYELSDVTGSLKNVTQTYDSILVQSGNTASPSKIDFTMSGSSLSCRTLAINNHSEGLGIRTIFSSNTLWVDEKVVMSNKSLTSKSYIRLEVQRTAGDVFFKSVYMENVAVAGNTSRLALEGGNVTLGMVFGGKGSYVGIGGAESGGTVTMNGSITTETLSVYNTCTHIYFGNDLFNTMNSEGDILLFDYQNSRAVSSDYPGNFDFLNKLLNQALVEAKGKDTGYDLSNAHFVYTGTQEDGVGPGSISLAGVKSVPEPTTITLGLLGLSVLMMRRRRF